MLFAAARGSREGIWLIYESDSESRAASLKCKTVRKDGERVSEQGFCTTWRWMQSGAHGGGNAGHRSQ